MRNQVVLQELLLYPNKNGTVADLLAEAKKHVTESPDSSGVLRLLEISTYKITQIVQDDVLLECLNTNSSKTYRIEEIPKDELKLQNGEFLIPVAHFQKEIYQTFGTPFLLKLKPVRVTMQSFQNVTKLFCFSITQKEPFSQVKERIQKKAEISDKEFEKYKIGIVTSGRVQYLEDDQEYFVNKDDFVTHGSGTFFMSSTDY